MRIEEMRSGLALLPNKSDEVDIDEIFRRVEMEHTEPTRYTLSELDDSVWSVIAFDEVQAGGLSYRQAVQLIDELDRVGVPGLCIVTDAAASRMSEQPSQSSR